MAHVHDVPRFSVFFEDSPADELDEPELLSFPQPPAIPAASAAVSKNTPAFFVMFFSLIILSFPFDFDLSFLISFSYLSDLIRGYHSFPFLANTSK